MSPQFLNSLAMRMLILQMMLMISGGLLVKATPLLEDDKDVCTADNLKKYLNEGLKGDEVELVYQHCRGKFLDENRLSESVKRTVDDWIGTDLSKAETNQIFLVYELAITAPKPEKVSEQFAKDCSQMGRQFQTYRETIEPLTQYIDINLDSLMTNGIEQIDEQEREMFNFVQYSQFCRSLLLDDDDADHLYDDIYDHNNDLIGQQYQY